MAGLQILLLVSCALFNSSFGKKSFSEKNDSTSVNVQELEIISNIAFKYANVFVRSIMLNSQKNEQETTFRVRLPKQAYITSFEIETKNRTIKAVLKEIRAVTEEFEQAKKENITVGLVSQLYVQDDLDINIFQIEVNVAAYSKIEFRLGYEEILQRQVGKYSQMLYIDTDQVIPNLKVTCNLKEKESFKAISYKTPFSRVQNIFKGVEKTDDDFEVKTIVWKPNETDQNKSVSSLEAPFEVTYSLVAESLPGIVFYNEVGEFIHFFSAPCNTNKILAKHIVFVIDISGSMNGSAIQQVRVGMKSILMQLRSKDYFNIIVSDDRIAMWKTSFQKANSENVDGAKKYIDKYVRADGFTNIKDALLKSVRLFETSKITQQTWQIIMFVTDGLLSASGANTNDILKNVRDANNGSKIRCIYPIALGKNADMSFLRSIAYQNAGSLTIIKDIESNIADIKLIDIYKSIENPMFNSLYFLFKVGDKNIPEKNLTQTFFVQYDCGDEIVISGRGPIGDIVEPHVKADNTFFFAVEIFLLQDLDAAKLSRIAGYQWVSHYLMEAESAIEQGKRDRAKKLALDLSLQYGFVTPLTSLVFTDYPTRSQAHTKSGNRNIFLDNAGISNFQCIPISFSCLFFGIFIFLHTTCVGRS